MIVECPKCATRYQFNQGRLRSSAPTLKCSRCGYVFLLPGAKKQPAPRPRRKDEDAGAQLPLGGEFWPAKAANGSAASAPGKVDDDDFVLEGDDDFVLERDDEAGSAAADDDITIESDGDEPWFAGDDAAVAAADAEEPGDAEQDEEEEQPAAAGAAEPEPASGPEPEFAAEAEAEAEPEPELGFPPAPVAAAEPEPAAKAAPRRRRRPPAPPPPPAASPLRPWLGLAAVLLVAYLGLTATLLARPALADRVLGSLPGFADLQESVVLSRSVHLSGLDAAYQLIGDKETAFVISGYATSTARQSIRDVEVRARLLDGEGRVLAEKNVWCGAATTPPVLSDLDTREVSVLQRIKPPARFAIAPGDAARFLVAFVDPPDGVARYDLDVVSAGSVAR